MPQAQEQAEAPGEWARIPFQAPQSPNPGEEQAAGVAAREASAAESAAVGRSGRSGRSRGLGGKAQFRTA